MGFTIPSNDVAGVPARQSVWYDVDIAILVAGDNGVGVLTGCAVTAQGSPDMTVAVAAGTIQATATSSPVTVTSGNANISTADATNPRIDLVTASATGTKTVTAGTAAAAPKPPALPSGHIALAMVDVPANDTTISTGQITDKRVTVVAYVAPEGGGRGEYASKYNPDHETPATTPADAEEFNGSKGMAWDSAPATDDLASYPGFHLIAGTTATRYLSKAWTPGSSDITIVAKVLWSMGSTDGGSFGLYVSAQTGTPVDGVFCIFEPSAHSLGLYNENSSSFSLVNAEAYLGGVHHISQPIYLRLTRAITGPVWTVSASYDGMTWRRLATTGSKALTIGAFGFRSDTNAEMVLDWIRCWTSIVTKVGA